MTTEIIDILEIYFMKDLLLMIVISKKNSCFYLRKFNAYWNRVKTRLIVCASLCHFKLLIFMHIKGKVLYEEPIYF